MQDLLNDTFDGQCFLQSADFPRVVLLNINDVFDVPDVLVEQVQFGEDSRLLFREMIGEFAEEDGKLSPRGIVGEKSTQISWSWSSSGWRVSVVNAALRASS